MVGQVWSRRKLNLVKSSIWPELILTKNCLSDSEMQSKEKKQIKTPAEELQELQEEDLSSIAIE